MTRVSAFGSKMMSIARKRLVYSFLVFSLLMLGVGGGSELLFPMGGGTPDLLLAASSATAMVPTHFPPGTTPSVPQSEQPTVEQEVPAGLSQETWADIQEMIRQAEYQFTWSEATVAYHAPNQSNGFRVQVAENGVRLFPLHAQEAWQWGLQLVRYGYADQMRSLSEPPQVTGDRYRVELRHSATLVEWYDNRERGLEHSFTLTSPPSGLNMTGAPLVLELRVYGTLQPVHAADENAILFRDEAGTTELHYDELVVRDADGRRLPAFMKLGEQAEEVTVQLVIDDREAHYPLVIDPIVNVIMRAELYDGHGQVGNQLGFSVALEDDVLLVGAPYVNVDGRQQQGAAYIFYRNQGGADSWELVATLVSPGKGIRDYFGWSVALSGDKAIVGALMADVDGHSDQGAVYAFFRDWGGADNWGYRRTITAANGMPSDHFGYAVAIDGNMVAVGAPGRNQGKVYLYSLESDGSLREVTEIKSSDGDAGDEMGKALALDGDLLLVGAHRASVGGNDNQGAAYLFARHQGGADNWGQVAKLVASDGAAGDDFGSAVALDGDMALVGAFNADVGGNVNQGAAYLFERNQGGADNWGQVAKLVASDGAAGDDFGSAVALREGVAVVGAMKHGTQVGSQKPGAVYLFARNEGGADSWGQIQKLQPASSDNAFAVGGAVAVSGDIVAAGAPETWVDGDQSRGAIYLYAHAGIWNQTTALFGATDDGAAGYDVDVSGDIIIVGVPSADVGGNVNQGAAYILYRNQGGGDSWGEVKKVTASDGETGALFGYSVAVDGDTAIVGAPYHGASNYGVAYILERNRGGADNWGETKKLLYNTQLSDTHFGHSVDISGDNVVVGAPNLDLGNGAAFFYDRDEGGVDNWGLVMVQSLINDVGVGDRALGWSVAIDGDWAVVGAPKADSDTQSDDDVGAAFVLYRYQMDGNGWPWGKVATLTSPFPAANDQFGYDVDIVGDTAIVGAPYTDVLFNFCGSGTNDIGSAFIFERHRGGTNAWGWVNTMIGCNGEDYFGSSVAIREGSAVVGIPGWDYIDFFGNLITPDIGAAQIFERNGSGADTWEWAATLYDPAGSQDDAMGHAVAISEDIVAVGAPGVDAGNTNSGAAYIFTHEGTFWDQVTRSTVTGGRASDAFGYAVAVSQDWLVVGAFHVAVGSNTSQGVVYIFRRGGDNSWRLALKRTASDGASGDQFGRAVAISGDVIAVGSPFADMGSNVDQGAVYLFEKDLGGVNRWGESKKLIASDGAGDDTFGVALSLDGERIAVGASSATVAGDSGAGAVYLFERNHGGNDAWGEVKKLIVADGMVNDYLGFAVALHGNTLAAGAPGVDGGGMTDKGAVYLFDRDQGGAGNWGLVTRVLASDAAGQERFGAAVDLYNDFLVVGAPLADVGGRTNAGAAYLFARNQGGLNAWGEVKKLTSAASNNLLSFGHSVAIEGDIVAVGEPASLASSGGGLVYLFARHQSGTDSWSAFTTPISAQSSGSLGRSVDLDGTLLAIGAPTTNVGNHTDQGKAYVFELDYQAAAQLKIHDAVVTEGDSGNTVMAFTVSITNATNVTVTVDYATANGTATAGQDYQAASGTLVFAPNETSKTISVQIIGDTTDESDETFYVNLTHPTNATISDGQGVGTIRDNDDTTPPSQPRISINDATVVEGDSGMTNATFTVSLSRSSGNSVTVDYATVDGTATAGRDYVAINGTLVFNPGETSKTITVQVIGDTIDEADETFYVNLINPANATISDGQGVGTIRDDDSTTPPSQPQISINDVTVVEGDSGTANATFTVSLSKAGSNRITVDYATADGTATAGSDYVATSGTLTFNPGETSKTITVQVIGDTANELFETFYVNLTNPINATISDGQGVGTIRDDDGGFATYLPLVMRNR